VGPGPLRRHPTISEAITHELALREGKKRTTRIVLVWRARRMCSASGCSPTWARCPCRYPSTDNMSDVNDLVQEYSGGIMNEQIPSKKVR